MIYTVLITDISLPPIDPQKTRPRTESRNFNSNIILIPQPTPKHAVNGEGVHKNQPGRGNPDVQQRPRRQHSKSTFFFVLIAFTNKSGRRKF